MKVWTIGVWSMFSTIFKLKQEGKIIGFTASTFDLLHAGHAVMLAEAKSHCDFLIVGLLTDPTIDRPDTKNKPVQTTFERWIQTASIEFVDLIIPFDTERDLYDMLTIIKPNVRIVGEEYQDIEFTGKHIKGIDIIYNKRDHAFSTSELRDRVLNAGPVKATSTHSVVPKS